MSGIAAIKARGRRLAASAEVRFGLQATYSNCGMAQSGIAALALAMGLASSVAAGPSTTGNAIGQESEIRHTNQKAEEPIEHGIALKKAGKLEEAEQIFRRIIREYPNATYEDELGAWRYSDDARHRLAVIACLKKRGPDIFSDSPEKLTAELKKAFLVMQTAVLARTGSCDFVVGATESDDMWGMNPKDVIPVIIGVGSEIDWDVAYSDTPGWLTLKTKRKQEQYTLRFEDEAGKWKWTGFFTSNKEILDRLRKIKNRKS